MQFAQLGIFAQFAPFQFAEAQQPAADSPAVVELTAVADSAVTIESEATQGQGPISAAIDWVVEHSSAEWLLAQVEHYGPNLLKAILVFVIGRWVARLVTNAVVRGARKARIDETLVGFLSNLMYMLLLTAVCISALQRLGVETGSMTAVLAAAGFAVGMAMQGSLGNLAAGVMLVFFKPFRVGDVVEVSGCKGTVVEIQIFNTILLTLDNVRIIVPNGKVTDGTIQNYSAERERRIDLVIGCGYHDDLKAVKAGLQQIVESHSLVLKAPAPVVAVLELGHSSVNFVVRPWVLSRNYWDVRFDLTEQIKLMFDENGFTIPFPSQDLFIHNPSAEKLPAQGVLRDAPEGLSVRSRAA
ncbi:MAG: mechanosensitive ion channel [Planctomycetaceae bacterium]